MTIISDGTLRKLIDAGRIKVHPFDPEMIQPASIDVRASGRFRVFRNDGTTHIDPTIPQPELTEEAIQEGDKPFVLHPGEFVLGSTVEFFGLPDNVVGRLEGKSSLGRLGLVIHSTAGFIDPGFNGTITLELSNAATLPICLWAGVPIGQVSFQYLDKTCEVPYGDPKRNSKYQGQVEPTASQMHRNWEPQDWPTGVQKTRTLPPPSETLVEGSEELTREMNQEEFLEMDPRCTCTFIGDSMKLSKCQRVPDIDCVIHGERE